VITRLAAVIAARKGLRRYGLAVLLGVVASGGLAPLNLLPLLIVAFTGLVWLLDGAQGWRAGFAIGWAFGFGFFVAGLHWIVFPLLVDADRFAWMIPFALILLPGGLALFVGAATAAATALAWSGTGRIVGLAVAWTLAEWIRGHLFSGFPWNLIGYAWIDSTAVVQTAGLVGVYGLSFLTVFAAAAPAALARRQDTGAVAAVLPVGAAVLVFAAAAFYGTVLASPISIAGEGLRLRIVQANIAQKLKWDAGERETNLLHHVQLSRRPGVDSRDLIVWPETASTFAVSAGAAVTEVIARAVPDTAYLLTGAPRVEGAGADFRAFNSLVAVDAQAQVQESYDKHHLVPFGEYLPLRAFLGRLGVDRLVQGSSVDFSAGPGARTIRLNGVPAFSPLICYEAIFPGGVADGHDRPAWLLNVTNDAWFGPAAGPAQHFAMARMRAVEQGLPLVRAANTGISAVVDSFGQVQQRLDVGVRGVIDADLPGARPPTLYARYGDLIVFTLLALAGLALGFRRWRP
jgi:apolipoprotein N-acyltransferase